MLRHSFKVVLKFKTELVTNCFEISVLKFFVLDLTKKAQASNNMLRPLEIIINIEKLRPSIIG
ncbi:hypothetical protein BIY24_00155 [Halobacteriovorax marinus]|uniref:hypothetical protein n=1 Tax=Halobacteriovorax marinus TaxID=97084 RepID=UPI00031FDAD8|nr:hypothetical protein [Halobacteriovorax marinus]ATH06410.1 hypothetical protein BIY24_00155 [Halobacteriovorax marinus]